MTKRMTDMGIDVEMDDIMAIDRQFLFHDKRFREEER